MRQGFGTDKELGYCIGSVGRDGGVHHGLRNEAGHCCNLGVHIDTLAQISHPVQDAIISDHNHLTKVLIHIVALNLSILSVVVSLHSFPPLCLLAIPILITPIKVRKWNIESFAPL